ncbi:MAG: PH domain-containing protein [Halolamina sp.]
MSSNPPNGPDEDEQDHGGSDEGIGGNYEVSEWLSLDPEEEVVWVGEPSMSSMIGTIATGVLLIPFLIGILILLATPLSYLSIKNTDFVVTSKSLYAKKGVLSTNIETVDLDKIQNTEYSQSFWGKQLGYGNIEISTAGSSGTDITFQAIENARAVRERISELSAGAGTGGSGEDGESADSAQLEELVSELRATRQALERVEAKMGEDRSDGHNGRAGGQRQDHEETGTDHQQD